MIFILANRRISPFLQFPIHYLCNGKWKGASKSAEICKWTRIIPITNKHNFNVFWIYFLLKTIDFSIDNQMQREHRKRKTIIFISQDLVWLLARALIGQKIANVYCLTFNSKCVKCLRTPPFDRLMFLLHSNLCFLFNPSILDQFTSRLCSFNGSLSTQQEFRSQIAL